MKSIRIAVITTVLAAVVAASAPAQSRGNARLSGKVVDEAGQPIVDAMVRATMVGQTDPMSGKTDKKGEWRLNGLAEGQWQIEIGKEGLAPFRDVLEIKNERPNPLNVTLKKPVDPTVEINAEIQRAAVIAQGGKVADARKIYEDLLVKYPTVFQLETFIARAYAVEGQPAKALEHLKIALEKDPNDLESQLLHADLLMETGDKAGAKAILDSVDITQVKDPFPFMNAAIVMINDGKGAEAAVSLTKLLAQFPTQHEIYYYRGRAYVQAQKFDDAKVDLEKFVSLAPNAKEAADAKRILDQLPKK